MSRVVSAQLRFAQGIWDLSLLGEGGSAVALLRFDDGSEDSFAWYHDEISFSAADFVGKTMAEIRELHRRRDLAYLRSGPR